MDLNKKFEKLGESMVNKTSYQFIPCKQKIIIPKKILVAAVIVILLLSVVVVTATPLRKVFLNALGGMGLEIAEKNSDVDYPLAEAEDQGVRIKIVGAAVGHDRIILSINFSGLKNAEQYFENAPKYTNTFIQPKDLKLTLENGETYYNIAQENYGVVYNGMTKNPDGSYTEIFEITGTIENTQKVSLNICKILDKTGQWNAQFDLTYRPSTVYKINKDFNIHDSRADKLKIKNIIMDSISTTIEYTTEHDSDAHYAVRFYSDKQSALFGKNFTGSTKDHVVKGTLSDGTEGYKYMTSQMSGSASLEIWIYALDEYNKSPKKYTINLDDFK